MQNKKVKNRGFTLVELLVSIAILVIVAIPLLNGFTTSNIASRKAKAIQKATTLAQNIMETIKSQDITTLTNNLANMRYSDLNILTPYITSNSEILSTVDSSIGSYEYIIKKIQDGTHEYDIYVTLRASDYKSPSGRTKDILTSNPPKQNTYEMPKIYNLKSEKIVTIDANGYGMNWVETPVGSGRYNKNIDTKLDKQALAYFKTLQENYINSFYPLIGPTPKDDLELMGAMEKQVIVNVNNMVLGDPSSVIIEAKVTYHMPVNMVNDDPLGPTYERVILNKILITADGTNPIEQIYLFYDQELISDRLVLNNAADNSTQVTIVSNSTDIDIDYENSGNPWSFYSNARLWFNTSYLGNIDISNELVAKEEAKNRMFYVNVGVYESDDGFKTGKKYCEFESTKGE